MCERFRSVVYEQIYFIPPDTHLVKLRSGIISAIVVIGIARQILVVKGDLNSTIFFPITQSY